MDEIYKLYKQIKLEVNEDVWEKIKELTPKTEEDFLSIHGIGDTTYKKIRPYVERIEAHYKKYTNRINASNEIVEKLQTLRDRLTNISQRNNIIWNTKETKNRLLDLSKLTKKSKQDIYKIFSSPNSTKTFNLIISSDVIKRKYAKTLNNTNKTSEEKREFINKKEITWFQSLYRENEKQKLEKGKNILYISPVIFEGRVNIQDKDIKIRTPLFFFPVELNLDKKRNNWTLNVDHSRDIFVNSFIEEYVLNLEDSFIYEYNNTLNENIANFAKLNKKISNNHMEIEPFRKVTVNDEWEYNIGNYSIKHNLLLGLFSDFGNDIQSEINDLIYMNDSTPMLTKFLANEDFHSRQSIKKTKNIIEEEINDDTKLFYTNKLNDQQLRALKMINQNSIKGITIWGPPGTGKSETIISIVENAVAEGKKVAVISEKQIALEVIKKRLKILKNNSILISDTKDKFQFYNQLNKMINKDFYEIDENISKNIREELKDKYEDLDLIYKKFGFNNKNVLEQISSIFVKPYLETPQSKKIAFEHEFFKFDNLSLDQYNLTFNFLEKINSKERLLLLKEVINEYYSKFENTSEIIENILNKIKKIVEEINKNKKILNNKEDINRIWEKHSDFYRILKNLKVKKELTQKYDLNSVDFKELKLGTLFSVLDIQVEKQELLKENFSNKIEKLEESKIDIDYFLKINKINKNLIKFIDDNNIEESIEAIKINIIKKLLKSHSFKDKIDLIKKYEKNLTYIEKLNKEFFKFSENQLKLVLNNNLRKISLNSRENSIKKITERKRPIAIRKFIKDYHLEMENFVKVWLMQPEVVPTLFSINEKFDMVIFDEASQIFLERTIPAIARAKKLVVLGDEKQLGPSSFFAGRITSDEDDDLIEQNESLLTYSKSKLPEVMLKNHYRSQHINLIQFSNNKYYEGGLNFIDTLNNQIKKPLEYIFVENSNYDDGLNKVEANKVIEILKKLTKKNVDASIGIITTNSKQEEYILNQIMMESYDLFEWLKNNDAFIKSIENVQGDERDIIIFSTTYGPDTNGKQLINFGPINQSLGSNRINVAITRAKKKMIVVSSIDLEQAAIKVANSLHQGPKDFIEYIQFAKRINESNFEAKEEKIVDEKDMTFFENEVHNSLMDYALKNNIKLIHNYETIGYKINYVLVDKKTDKKILAILFENSESNSSAREKDYLMKEFLESRGWFTYKIWSPNWWINRNEEIKKIDLKVKRILAMQKKNKNEEE
ncbi:MAG: hypothetical protein TYPL_4550 [Candidatus Tyloplasma litorale]|nr:MAG: hypothetical protein TYPL_4550 [Mycoplasmatales bacterium]